MSTGNSLFTPQQPSDVDYQTCERLACRRSFGLEVKFEYVPGRPGESGRMCCPDCARYYEDKRRRAQQAASGSHGAPALAGNEFTVQQVVPDAALKKASSAAQRGEVIYPAQRFPVAAGIRSATGADSMSMPPPMLPYGARGLFQTPSPSVVGGYRPDHAQYGQHRAKMASQTVPFGRLVTASLAIHTLKPEGKSGTALVGNIERDHQITHSISRIELYNVVVAVLTPLWNEWSCEYPFPAQAEMYKSPKLLLYDPTQPSDPNAPAVQEFYYHTRGQGTNPTFQSNKRLKIVLVISHQFYEDVLEWKEHRLQEKQAATGTDSGSHVRTESSSRMTELTDDRVDRLLGVHASPKRNKNRKRVRAASEDLSSNQALLSPQTPGDTPTVAPAIAEGPSKSTGVSQARTSASSSQTRDGTRGMTDVAALNSVLAVQGEQRNQAQAFLQQLAIPAQIYPIPNVTLDEVISKKTCALEVTGVASRHLVELYVDASTHIGTVGSFKTCHTATIKFLTQSLPSSLQATVLGVETVIAKRIFIPQEKDRGPGKGSRVKRQHLSPVDELPKLLDEANCIYWGAALLNLVYDFIAKQLPSCGTPIPDIPRLRFVRAGLAIPTDKTSPVYLVEEFIPGPFIKYILNNSLHPMPGLEDAPKDIAEFLVFTQHVQYQSTGGTMFLSDYQGDNNLMTDCQVITTDNYSNNFGLGNLSEILAKFERDHRCNHYCAFFNLRDYSVSSRTAQRSRTSRTNTARSEGSDMELETQRQAA